MNKRHEKSFNEYLTKGGLPCIDIKINNNNYVFLVDSGSDISYIDMNIAEDLNLQMIEGLFTVVTTLNADSPEAVTYQADIQLDNDVIRVNLTGIEVCATTKNLLIPFHGIIGVDVLSTLHAQIDFENNKLIY